MNSAVEAKLTKRELAQLKRAFTDNWKRPVQASDVRRTVGILLVILVVVVLVTAVSTKFFAFEIPAQVWQLMVALCCFAHYAVLQPQYALARKLHDIAAAALENEGKAESGPQLHWIGVGQATPASRAPGGGKE